MPGSLNRASPADATRRVAKVVFSTIKKIGNTRGVTFKKIHDYIKDTYPNTPTNIVRLNNTLEKALAFGAINKKIGNRYVLGTVIRGLVDGKGVRRSSGGIIEARRRRRRRGRSKSRRGRSRRRGRSGRRGRKGRRGRRRSISQLRRNIKSR